MKKLLESMDRFNVSDAVTEEEYCDACDRVKSKCICDDDLAEALMNEYRDFVPDLENEEKEVSALSPVAQINPRSRNQQYVVDEADIDPTTGKPVAPAPGQPATQQTTQPGQPAKPAQYRDYRPCRPWQDDPGRRPAEAVGLVPREPAGRRARHGLERP